MLTRKTSYGIRALASLARSGQKPLSVAELAAREGIPEHFLSVILSELRQRGIVRGRRGPDGGYQLEVDPRALNLAEVVESLSGPLFPFACLLRGADGVRCNECPGAELCAAQRALSRASAAAYEVLESIAIADLAQFARDGVARASKVTASAPAGPEFDALARAAASAPPSVTPKSSTGVRPPASRKPVAE